MNNIDLLFAIEDAMEKYCLGKSNTSVSELIERLANDDEANDV